jgi:hypothetical protein
VRRGVGEETGASGVRKVGASSNGDSIRGPNDGPMLPEQLRPAPGEGVYSGLIIPKAVPRLAKYFVVQRWARM